jgi:hypothetical protein
MRSRMRNNVQFCVVFFLVGCGLADIDSATDPSASGGEHGLESSGGAGGENSGGMAASGGEDGSGGDVTGTGGFGANSGGESSSATCFALSENAAKDFWDSLSPEQASCSGDQACDAEPPADARCFGNCGWKDSQEWNNLALMVCEEFYSQGCTDADVPPLLCVK